jgi:outer membrane lipoprotein-sorting protein
MPAHNLLSEVAAAYAACVTYADTGKVDIVFERRRFHPTYFRTYFKRPDHIRIDWSNAQRGGTDLSCTALYNGAGHVWLDGKKLDTGWPQSQFSLNSLDMLLAAAAGVSNGVAILIPPILAPRIGLVNIAKLDNPSEADVPQNLIEKSCSTIQVQDDRTSYVVSIDASHLIRRIEMDFNEPRGDVSHLKCTYEAVKLNSELPADAFEPL